MLERLVSLKNNFLICLLSLKSKMMDGCTVRQTNNEMTLFFMFLLQMCTILKKQTSPTVYLLNWKMRFSLIWFSLVNSTVISVGGICQNENLSSLLASGITSWRLDGHNVWKATVFMVNLQHKEPTVCIDIFTVLRNSPNPEKSTLSSPPFIFSPSKLHIYTFLPLSTLKHTAIVSSSVAPIFALPSHYLPCYVTLRYIMLKSFPVLPLWNL